MNTRTISIVENWRDLEKKNLNKHVFVDWAKLGEIALNHAKNNFEMPNCGFRVFTQIASGLLPLTSFGRTASMRITMFLKNLTQNTPLKIRMIQQGRLPVLLQCKERFTNISVKGLFKRMILRNTQSRQRLWQNFSAALYPCLLQSWNKNVGTILLWV